MRPETSQCASMLAVGARRIFTPTHDQFRESVRKFFDAVIKPRHPAWEAAGGVPREVWQDFGKQGLLGCRVPMEYGGAGADVLSAAVIWEEQAYSGCLGPAISVHSDIAVPYICKYGTNEQRSRFLPALCSGDSIAAIAMTEPNAGSDLQGIKTSCLPPSGTERGGDMVLNGSKTFITNGGDANVVLVVARTRTDVPASKGMSLVAVDVDELAKRPNNGGFTRGRNLTKLGLKSQNTTELFFDNVRVPESWVLGEKHRGFAMLMTELPTERLLIADMAVAAAEVVFESSVEYCRERIVFGQPLLKMQVTSHKLAAMKSRICMARAFVDSCIQLHHDGSLDTVTASMAKLQCTELQCSVVDACLQLHGGMGYMQESAVCRAFADARVQPIYGGANEIMTELIARSVVSKKP